MPRPITPAGREAFREFAEAVWEMRALQSETLATPAKDRPPDLGRRAREAEHRVDRLLVGRPEGADEKTRPTTSRAGARDEQVPPRS